MKGWLTYLDGVWMLRVAVMMACCCGRGCESRTRREEGSFFQMGVWRK
jgi:hypothetical protein